MNKAEILGLANLEEIAFAIIEGSAGIRAAEHARMFVTGNWADAMRSARAVLSTLKTPTPAMIAAGQAVDGTVSAAEVYRAMIDAAG